MSQTRVVFLQHPREFRVPVSTCRMAHLSLPNSELHIGLTAKGTPALEAACLRPDTAVLFPDENAVDADSLSVAPRTLIVIDGTWSNARKVVNNCPLLSALPRVAFRPERKSRYRIRAEPDDDFVSTIEATAMVLEKLERAPGRFQPILTAFDSMVERQLDFAGSTQKHSRHARKRIRNSVPADPFSELKSATSLVAVFGEANAWPLDSADAPDGEAELVQLVALRLHTGQLFETVMRPKRPLAPNVSTHLDLLSQALLDGEERLPALKRWQAFLGPDDTLVGWGRYCCDLLTREGVVPRTFLDLRAQLCQLKSGRPGSVEACAVRLGETLPEGKGRAVRRLASVAAVTRAVLEGKAQLSLAPRGPASP